MRFPTIQAGEEIILNPRLNDLHMACCDCNLVHILQFEIKGKNLIITAYRHNRKTAALRRYRGIPIKETK